MVNRADGLNQLNSRPRLLAPPPQGLRAIVVRYGFATGIVGLAIVLRLLIQPFMPADAPIIVPLVAVMACAAFGGLGPAIWSMLLGAIGGYLHFRASGNSSPEFVVTYRAELRLFLLEGAFISAFGAWLHIVRRRAQRADLENAELEKQMLDIGDRERRRFGHDLHDGLGQQLTGIALLSETLAHRLQAQGSPSFEQADQIAKLVSETVGWTRELARGLSPLTLESDGLLAAVEELASRMRRLFQMNCIVECTMPQLQIEEDRAIHVYRIIQEAVSNSAKHGKAKNVTIRLSELPEHSGFEKLALNDPHSSGDGGGRVSSSRGAATGSERISITVLDDGSGLSAKTVAQPGIGLRIMQYRANLIGAMLSVARRSAQGGTVVSCVLPIDRGRSTDVVNRAERDRV